MLKKFDDFLKSLSKKDKIMLYLLPFIIFGFFSYYYVVAYFKQKYQQSIVKKENLQKRIYNYQLFLSHTNPQKDTSTKEQIQKLKDLCYYIDYKLSSLKNLQSSKKTWSKFLDLIVQNSIKNNIKINSLHSTIKDINISGNFEIFAFIELNATAKQSNLLSFLGDIKSSGYISSIDELNIEKNQGFVKFGLWGFK